jgi:hypothetical protein
MTEDEFAEALLAIGWTGRQLAAELACDERMVRRWARGEAPVPAPIARWLGVLQRFHANHPAPEAWRTRTPPGG